MKWLVAVLLLTMTCGSHEQLECTSMPTIACGMSIEQVDSLLGNAYLDVIVLFIGRDEGIIAVEHHFTLCDTERIKVFYEWEHQRVHNAILVRSTADNTNNTYEYTGQPTGWHALRIVPYFPDPGIPGRLVDQTRRVILEYLDQLNRHPRQLYDT